MATIRQHREPREGLRQLRQLRPSKVFSSLRDFVDALAAGSPARLALIVFALVILVFTGLLSLPASSSSGQVTPLHDALFTAVSAVCVTGLTVVSTATHWSGFGQVLILIAIQAGGLGILTMASLLALAVNRRLGVRGKLIAQEGMNTGRLGEVGSLLRIVVSTTVVIELILALVMAPRFMILGESAGQAIWHAVFYSVSAFNNAGFTPHSDGLVPYDEDLWILIPLMVGVFLGSLGFPVIMVLLQSKLHIRQWNLHTKLTLLVTGILLVGGSILWGAFEWFNTRTIGDMNVADRILHSVFASVMTRSGGFSLVDMSDLDASTLLITDMLMFAGGGSASTAGGIKVTTLAVIFLAIVAEARGDSDVRAFGRTIAYSAMRVAISVVILGATMVAVSTVALLAITQETLQPVLFEVISAFATCGLSIGLSEVLPPEGKYLLSALMFAGRVGTITLAAALAIRQRSTLYHYPEERPIIG
ncbi:potassium transporter TrkG [Arthrobacter sp. APC 3897]|uniref:TrkH family potassium uptake protein n=1 Tax=Arthrobacter sp. APC 3897 TaxID=3035204 RepID=UPI0025B36864|nr:potassium transporter TrkG [Arthrobacter sp. APC 3897]MDN3482665.1 potassium transporter TrkG [Arthrobacter sp. APC 3897]